MRLMLYIADKTYYDLNYKYINDSMFLRFLCTNLINHATVDYLTHHILVSMELSHDY